MKMRYYIVDLSNALKVVRFKEIKDLIKKKKEASGGEIGEFTPEELDFILANIMRGYNSDESAFPVVELSVINKDSKMFFEINQYGIA